MTQFSIAHDQAYIIPTIRLPWRLILRSRFSHCPLVASCMDENEWIDEWRHAEYGIFFSVSKYFVKFIQAYERMGYPSTTSLSKTAAV